MGMNSAPKPSPTMATFIFRSLIAVPNLRLLRHHFATVLALRLLDAPNTPSPAQTVNRKLAFTEGLYVQGVGIKSRHDTNNSDLNRTDHGPPPPQCSGFRRRFCHYLRRKNLRWLEA